MGWFRRRDVKASPGSGLGGVPPTVEPSGAVRAGGEGSPCREAGSGAPLSVDPTPAGTSPVEAAARMLHPAYTAQQVAATTRAVTDDTVFLLTANDPSTFRLYQERLLEVAQHPARAYSALSALSTFAVRLILAPPAPGTPRDEVIQDWRGFLDAMSAQVVAEAEKRER